MKVPVRHAKDRRVKKTKDLLHGALGSLIREKSYDRIVVKEILARANVGRSTFYMHFRDKDDLLVSHIQDIVRSGPTSTASSLSEHYERVIWFSLPILERIHEHNRSNGQGSTAKNQVVLHEHLQQTLTELITHNVRYFYEQRNKVNPISLDILARYVVSTFMLVLNWWLESRNELEPIEVDKVFRSLVLPTLTTIWN